MKRILLLMLLLPVTAKTQVTQSQFDSLVARVNKLERAQGPYSDSIPPVDSFPTKCVTLPNGRYTIFCRVQQIGLGIDANNNAVNGALARLAAVESAVAGGQPIGTAVFDRIRVNQICLGADCNSDWNAQLQMRCLYSCVMGMESNLAKVDPQDPTHTHVSQISVSQDGGTRIQQNAMSTFSRGFISYVNPCRPWLNFGPDSRSSVSIYKGSVDENTCTPIPHDGTQDAVFDVDENARQFVIRFWRPNWSLAFNYSTCIRCGDITVVAPKQ